MDEDGYLTIVGRIKEMIIRGGENIYPREIEQLLLELADIDDAHVVGVPDERYGEELVAYLKLKSNVEANICTEQLKTVLKDKVNLAWLKRRIFSSFTCR